MLPRAWAAARVPAGGRRAQAARARAQGLLRGISTRSELTTRNWATRLSDRLRAAWQAGGVPGQPPFAAARGQEALEYARLPAMQRRVPRAPRAPAPPPRSPRA